MNYVLLYVSNSMTLIVWDFPSLVEGKEELTLVDRFSFSSFLFPLGVGQTGCLYSARFVCQTLESYTTDLPAQVFP